MEIAFDTAALREICEKREAATSTFGKELALDLEQLLADLEASTNAEEFLALVDGNAPQNGSQNFSVIVPGKFEIVFRSGHVKTPTDEKGSVKWGMVKRVILQDLRVVI